MVFLGVLRDRTRRIDQRSLTKFKIADSGQRILEDGNSKSDSESYLLGLFRDNDSDSEIDHTCAKKLDKDTNTQKPWQQKAKHKQREKHKRLSTGVGTGESSEQYEHLSNDDKLSLILTKLFGNENRFKSLEKNQLGAFEVSLKSQHDSFKVLE